MRIKLALAVSVAFVLAGNAAHAQSGNAARGERLFNQQCKACHAVEAGAPSPTGPNLHGLFGRKAGTAAGFEASPAMAKSGIVWDDKTLATYLKDPKAAVPETKMVFAGIKQQVQLDDVIAYLEKATK
jgi:cytochrome c